MRPSLLEGLMISPQEKEVVKEKDLSRSKPVARSKNVGESRDTGTPEDKGKFESIFKRYIHGNNSVTSGARSKAIKSASSTKSVVNNTGKGFDLNKLPRRYNHWLLDVVKPSHFGGHRCVLRSNVTEMEDGYLQTPVVLEVFSDLIKVSGQSPIDLSYSGLGIKVDAFDRVSIDAIVSETNALFFLELKSLIEQMTKGEKLVVALGFWPVTPLDQAYSTEISLRGFSSGIKKLGECEETLSRVSFNER